MREATSEVRRKTMQGTRSVTGTTGRLTLWRLMKSVDVRYASSCVLVVYTRSA